jgi:prolyl-tRNA synthetase
LTVCQLYNLILPFPIVGEKIDISVADACTIIPALLATIQSDMFIKAKAGRDEKMATVLKWEDFVPALERDCLVLTPFCDQAEWEDKVKVSSLNEA